jgi:signal transduction histidine kinase
VILDALLARERLLADREHTIQQAAEKSISVVSHNIATRFAGLAALISRYRNREKNHPEIRKLNDDFAHAYQAMISELNHVKEMFRGAAAHPESIETKQFVTGILEAWLDSSHFKVTLDQGTTRINADRRLLSGILNELCKNSLDAKDKSHLTVKVAFSLVGQNVRIEFCDNGPGIPKNLKERIFEDFFTLRAHGSAGTGLGLTYVKKAVQAHGGRVWEEGVPGEGARFVIEFPSGE